MGALVSLFVYVQQHLYYICSVRTFSFAQNNPIPHFLSHLWPTVALFLSIPHHLTSTSYFIEPGGYLQWAEYDMTSRTTIKASPSLSSSALDAIPAFVQGFQKEDGRIGKQKCVNSSQTPTPAPTFPSPPPPSFLRKPKPFYPPQLLIPPPPGPSGNSWIPLLPQTLHAHHLTHIHTSRHRTPPPSLHHQLDVFLLTYEELACKTLDRLPVRDSDGDSGGGHGDTLREMIEAASHEGRRGVAWGMDRLVVVGRKPGPLGRGK